MEVQDRESLAIFPNIFQIYLGNESLAIFPNILQIYLGIPFTKIHIFPD